MTVLLAVFLAASLGLGCSDDTQPMPKDLRAHEKGTPDGGADLAVDGPDAALDQSVDSGRDGQGDEAGVSDGAADAPKPRDTGAKLDISGAGLYGTITTKVAPVFDGKGPVYVGFYTPWLPPPFPPQMMLSVVADLSKVGNTATYQFAAKPPAGDYLLYAFLDDNGNAAQPFIAADSGDVAMAQAILVKIPAGTTPFKLDIELGVVIGGVTDAGVGEAGPQVGSLEGLVRVSAKPTLDAKGNVYASLHDSWPPADTLISTVVAAADLSSPFASVKYFLGNLVPGQYYLRVFLDDNNTVNFFATGPDKDDLIHGAAIPVRIEPGVQAVQDATLNTVSP